MWIINVIKNAGLVAVGGNGFGLGLQKRTQKISAHLSNQLPNSFQSNQLKITFILIIFYFVNKGNYENK